MARRRMFSPDIVCSDTFLDMPATSRELYFQLGMVADDDGFANPKRVMRSTGASDDDLRILLSKNFLIPFDNGVIVVKHWRIHNRVRPDMYVPTLYSDQRSLLFQKKNMAYTLDSSQGEPVRDVVRDVVRDIGKDRLGKYINTPSLRDAEKKN